MRLPSSHRVCFALLFATISTTLCGTARADSISFTLSQDAVSANPGDNIVFKGTISNSLGTGETLDAFSFFFDFNNFDVSALSNPLQILPLDGIDFDVPDGGTSQLVELFSLTLLNGAVAGKSYSVDVTAQAVDASGETLQGNTLEATITAGGGSTEVPEPATVVLLSAGCLSAVLLKKKLL